MLEGCQRLALDGDDVVMNARRVVIVLTCVVVAGLGATFALTQWDNANRIATSASALASVAAVGVAVWAGLAASRTGVRASRTGKATATGQGSRSNSGVAGSAKLAGPALADRTGDARAAEGGSANSGADLRP